MRPTCAFLVCAFIVLLPGAGCASKTRRTAPAPSPLQERAIFVEQRATELMRRGVPKDQAVQKASGEWFNETIARDDRAAAEQRAKQAQVHRELSKLEREARER